MAVFSTRYRYIFFANPQTASKAIALTLHRELGGKVLHKRITDDQRAALTKRHHLTYPMVVEHELLPRPKLDKLVRVTGVRNPYDLMVSRYLKHRDRFTQEADRYRWVQRENNAGVRRSMALATANAFPAWLTAQYGDRSEVRGYRDYLDHADLVIRFEAIQADFDAMLRHLGIDRPIAVVRENVTVQRSVDDGESGGGDRPAKLRYADFYDEGSRALVGRLFGPVIERFGYRFEE